MDIFPSLTAGPALKFVTGARQNSELPVKSLTKPTEKSATLVRRSRLYLKCNVTIGWTRRRVRESSWRRRLCALITTAKEGLKQLPVFLDLVCSLKERMWGVKFKLLIATI
jgi:hypothetical protein